MARALLVAVFVGLAFALAVSAGWLASQARADGDPASDVLASQSLFLPGDAGIPAARSDGCRRCWLRPARAGFRCAWP